MSGEDDNNDARETLKRERPEDNDANTDGKWPVNGIVYTYYPYHKNHS